jgi:predicted esterase
VGGEQVRRRVGIHYGLGQSLDIYEPEQPRGSVAILLWHGSGPNERDVMEPLADQIAVAGVPTLVPDWSGNDGGEGKHHLTASLSFTRDLADRQGIGQVVLAGWSMGATAGLDVVELTTILGGWRPAAFVGLSGGFDGSPFSGTGSPPVTLKPSVPLLLIHGSSDEVVPVEGARTAFETFRDRGWQITLREVPTDHAGAIGTIYDPILHRCVPTDDPVRREQLTTIARWIADFACLDDGRGVPPLHRGR